MSQHPRGARHGDGRNKEGRVCCCALLGFRERPGLHALTQATKAMSGPGATFEHLPWEAFISLEEELRLSRAGKIPKQKGELVYLARTKGSPSKTRLSPLTHTVRKPPIWKPSEDTWKSEANLLPTSKLPATKHTVPLPTSTLQRLTGTVTVPQGICGLRQLRKCADLIEPSVEYHCDHEELPIWRLLDPVTSSLPDQGIEREIQGIKRNGQQPGQC